MLFLPKKVALATIALFGVSIAIVSVNARLSWRPVVVDFSSFLTYPTTQATQPVPIAWQENKLWLLATPEVSQYMGDTSQKFFMWGKGRNWNRAPVPIMRATPFDSYPAPELATLCPGKDEFVISRGRSRLELWQKGHFRYALEKGFPNESEIAVSQARLVNLSPDGTHLAVCSLPRALNSDDTRGPDDFCPESIVVFDVSTRKRVAVYDGKEGSFSDFAWSPDSRNVAGITSSGWVFILDTKTGTLLRKFRAHQLLGAQIAWSPDGKVLVTATNSRLGAAMPCLCFDSPTMDKLVVNRTGTTRRVGRDFKIEFEKKTSGQIQWHGRDERLIKRFDAHTGKQIEAALPLKTGAADLAFSPDGRQLAIGEYGFALILDASTMNTERRLPMPASIASSSQAPVCVAWSPDGATLATSTQQGLTFWRVH